MKKTNKANFKKIVGGVLAAVMAAAMVATAVIRLLRLRIFL